MKSDRERLSLLTQFEDSEKFGPRIHRYCSSDIMLAAWVSRAVVRDRVYEVFLFLAEDHWQFQKESGVRAALSMILADAYRSTRTMNIVFRGPRNGQRASRQTGYEPAIPDKILALAEEYGLSFASTEQISHEEGVALFLYLAGFSADDERFVKMGVDPLAVAFLVKRSILTKEQVVAILHWSQSPREIYSGALRQENILRYQRELIVLRSIIAAERARNLFVLASRNKPSLVSYQWYTDGSIQFVSSGDLVFNQSLLDPTHFLGQELVIKADQPFRVVLLPRLTAEYEFSCASDFQRDFSTQGLPVVFVTTYDFELVNPATRQKIELLLGKRAVVCTLLDTCGGLDQEVRSLLTKCRNFATDLEVITDA